MPDEDSLPLATIFFPFASERAAEIRARMGRFVYYTRAEVVLQILRSKQIWFRNARLMNDFSEIAHGFAYLKAAYQGDAGNELNLALATVYEGLPAEVETLFNGLLPAINSDTYLACFSEHDDSEDMRGRLSMWRGYGGTTGVALVINGAVMHSSSAVLGVFSSPVFYGEFVEFADNLRRVAANIRHYSSELRSVGRETIRNLMFEVLRYAVLCTKHPGFQEEREWRVIGSPPIFSTPRLRTEIEVVRGVPQKVAKIDLVDDPQAGLVGLELPKLVNRVIIGPCAYPEITAMALGDAMTEAGIAALPGRIAIADIPLRHDP